MAGGMHAYGAEKAFIEPRLTRYPFKKIKFRQDLSDGNVMPNDEKYPISCFYFALTFSDMDIAVLPDINQRLTLRQKIRSS